MSMTNLEDKRKIAEERWTRREKERERDERTDEKDLSSYYNAKVSSRGLRISSANSLTVSDVRFPRWEKHRK